MSPNPSGPTSGRSEASPRCRARSVAARQRLARIADASARIGTTRCDLLLDALRRPDAHDDVALLIARVRQTGPRDPDGPANAQLRACRGGDNPPG
ncbi:hypothetical protein ACIQ9J_24895 [Streptomyces sp. NPDC094153]|uniref:hypothetical protein n=1 Tax=Streptomyces sp. NPDC094153 TaxID=3366058 RepID=UPI00381824CB